MAGQQAKIYQAYKEQTERNNVEPTVKIDGDAVWQFIRKNGIDFQNPYSHTTRYWDNGPSTRTFKLADGRVAEYATTNSAMGWPLMVVFDRFDDWFNYRRAMGMFHYLYT